MVPGWLIVPRLAGAGYGESAAGRMGPLQADRVPCGLVLRGMPSPVGHALAGLAAGWAVAPPSGPAGRGLRLGAVFALAAVLPDLDLLTSVHRGPTHGLGAAVLAGSVAWVWWALGGRRMRSSGLSVAHGETRAKAGGVEAPWRLGLAVGAAWGTHTLLDWLGADTSPPIGLMALWPFSRDYYASHLDLFLAVSRRFWRPDFLALNLHAIAREVVLLAPLAAAVILLRGQSSGRSKPAP